MKNKKSDRIECYDTTAVLKNLFLLSQKLLDRFEQVIIAGKKGKSTKTARWWTRNKLKLFQEVVPDMENKFSNFLKKFTIKK